MEGSRWPRAALALNFIARPTAWRNTASDGVRSRRKDRADFVVHRGTPCGGGRCRNAVSRRASCILRPVDPAMPAQASWTKCRGVRRAAAPPDSAYNGMRDDAHACGLLAAGRHGQDDDARTGRGPAMENRMIDPATAATQRHWVRSRSRSSVEQISLRALDPSANEQKEPGSSPSTPTVASRRLSTTTGRLAGLRVGRDPDLPAEEDRVG